jgi:CRISPR-associated protein Cmx8
MVDGKTAIDPTQRIYKLVRAYVMTRTERKCGFAWDSFKDRKIKDEKGLEHIDVPPEYRKERESVCTSAFLRIRSCRSRQDFIDYFTGTICSVPQYLPPAEFEQVSMTLLDEENWEDVKALAMLALSGLSRV